MYDELPVHWRNPAKVSQTRSEIIEKGISIYERIMIQQIAKSLKNSVELSKIKLKYAYNEGEIDMYTCASCTVLACANNEPDKMPKNCPMRNTSVMKNSRDGYDLPENHDFYINCSSIEGLGYCQWPRLKETIEFCKRMNYHKLGLAFCKGLRKEARIVADLLRAQGFEVVSVICKTGGISKEEVGIPEEVKIHPGEFEAMCNPIAQAKLLNEQQTEFNIEIGLCVGHDSMFFKYSDAMVTTLVAKDRVLAHNPCGAIYCAEGYFKKRLE